MNCFGLFSGERKGESSKTQQDSSTRGSNFGKGWGDPKRASTSATGSSSISQSASYASTTSTNSSRVDFNLQRQNSLRVFSFSELKSATNNFSRENHLGEGGFGCVYKGVFMEPTVSGKGVVELEAAVKQLNTRGQQGYKQWLAEVKSLERVSHPNLVKLLGYCDEDHDTGSQMLLVYEFMPNKSLDDHLFRKAFPILTWQRRLQIAVGVAQGLQYLHELSDVQIIFRDLKPSNILLDNDYTPKISDFGLAREGPDANHSHVSTKIVGTRGYVAPEYYQTGHLNAKSDIWSFGILLFELLTGRKAFNSNLPKSEQHLIDWVKPYIGNNKRLKKIMDPRLGENYSIDSAEATASLACQCTSKVAKARPKMREVVDSLKKILEMSGS